MADLDQAVQTQLANIQERTGRSLDELFELIEKAGLEKHGQIRTMLKESLGMGHGDANTLTHVWLHRDDGPSTPDDEVERIYAGPKAGLRPIHDAVMAAVEGFGAFEVAPKKAYLSLRRSRQFAMIGPATKTQVEIGLNVKDLPESPRITAQKPGGMCQYKTRLSDPSEVDDELLGWIRAAYDGAG
jgi:hypothetical protein